MWITKFAQIKKLNLKQSEFVNYHLFILFIKRIYHAFNSQITWNISEELNYNALPETDDTVFIATSKKGEKNG